MDQRFWAVEPTYLAAAQPDAADPGAGAGGPPADESAAARDALEQRFAEQLLEDEALRGDLTDDEYQPLQDWALEQLHTRAAALADPTSAADEQELEHAAGCLRRVLRAASETIGRRADLGGPGFTDGFEAVREALEPALYGAEGPATAAQGALGAILPELAAHKDELDGIDLVEAVLAALRGEHTAVGGEGERVMLRYPPLSGALIAGSGKERD